MVHLSFTVASLLIQPFAALDTIGWKRRTLYQIVTDRFALETGKKDTCYEDQVQCRHGAYCGGSWKGITEKLDYISGMGFDAIWISPIASNTKCGYHGYWIKNLNQLNHRMGLKEDLLELIATAHSKNIMVMFDGVLNHVGPKTRGKEPSDFSDYAPLSEEEYFHGGWKLATSDGTDNDGCGDAEFSSFNFSQGHCLNKCAPDQYFREVCWSGEADSQLPDLRQEHPKVQKMLMNQIKNDLAVFKFDGFRIDAAAYMNKTFLRTIKKEALIDTYVVAEVAVVETTEYIASYQYTKEAKFLRDLAEGDRERIRADHIQGPIVDGVLNYELFYALRRAFNANYVQGEGEHHYDQENNQGSLVDFKHAWQKLRATYLDIGANMNFIDSHDKTRWLHDSNYWDTYKNALTVAFFLPGIPLALYGAEQGIRGGTEDNDIRQALWSDSPGYDQSSHLYQWTRRLVAARKVMLDGLSDDELDSIQHFVAEEHFMSFQRGNALVVISKHPTTLLKNTIVSVPTSIVQGTLLCNALQLDTPKYHCNYVNNEGMLEVSLNGRPCIMAPPHGAVISTTLLVFVRGMVPLWFLPVLILLGILHFQTRLIHIIEPLRSEDIDGPIASGSDGDSDDSSSKVVLVASIEHIIASPEGKTVKVVAGGLGKVAGLLCQHHPGPLISVHPCMSEQDYCFAHHDGYVTASVMGEEKTCEVLTYDRNPLHRGPRVTFVLVDHQIFRDRKDGIYPAPNTRASVLAFYSLWNQAVGKIIDRFKPDFFHCPDYHTAMAVLYIERPLPVVVTLHNAGYQGIIDTQQMGFPEVNWFADLFNVNARTIRNECMVDGAFNMLLPIIRYVKKHQRGYGISAVSRSYAQECYQKYSIFWGLPELTGIENCLPDSDRFYAAEQGEASYWKQKRKAKEDVQKEYDLEVNPEALLFVFLGRWVKQKGMDYIADVTEWMLTTYPKAQLIMIGPVGDSYGSYSRMRMQGLMENAKFHRRLFVYAGFLNVSKDLKLATDFCLMPSRDEPFGYVDIEFAWYGAAIVGSFRGGLGKVPGFYYKVFDTDSARHCQDRLKEAISAAMECDAETRGEMTRRARESSFPVEDWCNEMSRLYSTTLYGFKRGGGLRSRLPSREVVQPLNVEARTLGVTGRVMGSHSRSSSSAAERAGGQRPGLRGGLATIASVGDNLDNINFQDPLAHLDLSVTAQEVDAHDNTDTVSVLSMETSPSQERNILEGDRLGSWSRQVSPMLSGLQVPADMARGISGLNIALPVDPRREFSLHEPLLMEEFLRQGPVEDDVMGIVEAKAAIATFTKQSAKHAETLLEETLWELEICRETKSTTMFLGCSFCGVLVIDWLISIAYIAGPLMSVALMGTAAYSSNTDLLDELWEIQRLITQGFFTIIWTIASVHCRGHYVMAFAVFSRVFQIIVAVQKDPRALISMGGLLPDISATAVLCGAIQAGDVTLLYFNFMGQSIGEIQRLAYRTGLAMALQNMSIWLVVPLRQSQQVLLEFVFILSFAICIVVPLCVLQAPAVYREFRLPSFWSQFKGIFRLKVAGLMGLASIFHGFTYAPDTIYLHWRTRAPRPDTFQDYCVTSVLGTLFAPVLLTIMIQQSPDTTISIMKAFACFSSPVLALRCWPLLEVSHADGVNRFIDIMSIFSVALDVVSAMAFSVAMLATLGSRWRFAVYICTVQVFRCFTSAGSFAILQAATQGRLPMDIMAAMQPEQLTNQLMLLCILPCIPEFFCRMLAFRFFDQELVGMLWTPRHRKMERLIRSRNEE